MKRKNIIIVVLVLSNIALFVWGFMQSIEARSTRDALLQANEEQKSCVDAQKEVFNSMSRQISDLLKDPEKYAQHNKALLERDSAYYKSLDELRDAVEKIAQN